MRFPFEQGFNARNAFVTKSKQLKKSLSLGKCTQVISDHFTQAVHERGVKNFM